MPEQAHPAKHPARTVLAFDFGLKRIGVAVGEPELRSAHPLPDLVLLDLKLPGIDGHEVLRQIKSTPVLKRVPVVVLTSSREERDRLQCYDVGANSFLVKPIDFDGFMDVVREVDAYWLNLNVPPSDD